MTWRSSRRFSLLLVLLFCSSLAFSQVVAYDGPVLPEGWNPIHDLELDQISQELTMLDEDLQKSTEQLAIARTTSTVLQATVGRLERSLITSDREAQIWRRATLIVGSVGALGWLLFVWPK